MSAITDLAAKMSAVVEKFGEMRNQLADQQTQFSAQIADLKSQLTTMQGGTPEDQAAITTMNQQLDGLLSPAAPAETPVAQPAIPDPAQPV